MQQIKKTQSTRLFGTLVDLSEQELEHLSGQALRLVQQLLDASVGLLLVLLEERLELHLIVELLDLVDLGGLVAAVVVLEHLALLGGRAVQGLHHQPGALVVLDVRADLADHLGGAEVVQVVVLDLEVLAHDHEDLSGGVVQRDVRDARDDHATRDGQVEAVEGSLVLDDADVALDGESIQVDGLVQFLGSQVQQLAELGLAGGLEEQVHQLVVVGLLAEVLLEDLVHEGLEDETVVDGDGLHLGQAEPAGLASAGHAVVHEVIGDQEEGLQELDAPAQRGGLAALLVGQGVAHQLGESVSYTQGSQASVHLAAGHGVGQHAADPLGGLGAELVGNREVVQDLLAKLVEHLLEEDLVIGGEADGDLEGHRGVDTGRSAEHRQGTGGGLRGDNTLLLGVLRRRQVHGTTEVHDTNKYQG
eukprot:Colp12_sorted_trinity150504_noHs@13455